MKLTLKEPIVIEETTYLIFKKTKEYPYANLRLSLSTQFGNPDGYSMALTLTPYRIVDGEIETLQGVDISVSKLNAMVDEETKELVETIIGAIQTHIVKG